jgi:hypothetical protein
MVEEGGADAEGAHADQPFADRALLHVAELGERAQQAVDGGHRQRQRLGDRGQRRAALGRGQRLQDGETARECLRVSRRGAAAEGSGLRLGARSRPGRGADGGGLRWHRGAVG